MSFQGINVFRMDPHYKVFRILLDDEIWHMGADGTQEMVGRVSTNPNEDLSGGGVATSLHYLPDVVQNMLSAYLDRIEVDYERMRLESMEDSSQKRNSSSEAACSTCCEFPSLCPTCGDKMHAYYHEQAQVSQRETDK